MGCTASKLGSNDDCSTTVVVSLLHKTSSPRCGKDQDPLPSTHAPPATTVQDLPPLLLARILSDHCSWQDLFGSIPLVCRAWRDVAQCATPEHLSFEFDICDSSALAATAGPQEQLLILQQQQQHGAASARCTRGPAGVRPSSQGSSSRQRGGCQQQQLSALQAVQLRHGNRQADHALFRWLQQHCLQLQDLGFSVRASPPGSVCAAAQCDLKQHLLQALAEGSGPACCCCCDSSSCSSSSEDDDDGDDQYDTHSTCWDSQHSSAACSKCGLPCCAPQQHRHLNLRSLLLQLPLFEDDINLLADGICSRAPLLQTLTMVGFASFSSRQLARGSFSGRHYTALNKGHYGASSTSVISRASIGNPANAVAAHSLAGQSPRHSGNTRGSAGRHLSSSSSGSTQQNNLKSHGFITGSSLHHLMESAQQLRSFTFASRQLYKAGWLASATQLTHLALCDCQLHDSCLEELQRLNLPHLRQLDLSTNAGLGADGSKSVELVAKLTRLTELNISGWGIGPAGTKLQPLAGLKQLAALQMDGCGLVKFSAVPFASLKGLTSLSLADNLLSFAGVEQVCSLTQLQQLDLSGISRRDSMLPVHQQQTFSSASCWAGFSALPGLTEMRIADNFWPDCFPQPVVTMFLRQFCNGISGCSNLSMLDASGCKFPHKLMQALVRSLPASLSTITLDGCVGVTRCDLEPLAQLPGLKSVSLASLNPPLRDKHCVVLAKCSNLHQLVLAGNDIGPKGVAVLSEMALTELDVSGNARLASSSAAAAATAAAAAGW